MDAETDAEAEADVELVLRWRAWARMARIAPLDNSDAAFSCFSLDCQHVSPFPLLGVLDDKYVLGLRADWNSSFPEWIRRRILTKQS